MVKALGQIARKSFSPLSIREEQIGKAVVDAAYTVHKALGPGLLVCCMIIEPALV